MDALGKKLTSVVSRRQERACRGCADGAVAYKDVIAAMNAIKDAKIEKVSLLTQAEANAR